MVKLRLSLPVCAYLAAVGAISAQSSYVFQLPGNAVTGQTPQIVAVGDNDFSRIIGPASSTSYAGASKVIATPDGNKFYFVTSGGMFTAGKNTPKTPTALSAISGPVSDAQLSPDGKYLLVVTAHLYIVRVADDSVAALADTGVPPGASPVAVAVSQDAKTAWILTNQRGSVLTSVDLTQTPPVATSSRLNLLTQATSMVLSPRGLLYATAGSHLYEIDPATFAATTLGDMQISGQAGPLQFTPDGSTAYFVNQGLGGSPMFKLTIQAHSISEVVPPSDGSTPPRVDQVLVAGNNRVFAFSSATHALYDVAPSPLALTPAVIGVLPTGSVAAAAVSNESPSSQYLYLLFTTNDHAFDRIKLATNAVDQQSTLDPAVGSILTFVAVPVQSGAATVSVINPSQTVTPGAPVVLIGQVLDSVGHPVMGANAAFSGSGITISNPNVVTTAGGWAQTTVTAPIAAGIYSVTLSSGGVTPGTFTINVNAAGSGGNSGGSGVPTMSIYAGDGELLRQNQSTNSTDTHVPLTVKVVDENGNPLPNVSVTFALETGGIGFLIPLNQGLTDQDGLARADYIAGSLPGNTTIMSSKILASSSYGSVEFNEVTHNALLTDLQQPNSLIVTPATTRTITVQQGVIAAGAIAVQTIAEKNPGPIPGVGLRLADPNAPANPSPVASCQGLSRGDNNGISRCDVLAVCQPSVALPHDYGVFVYAGEHQGFSLTITVTKGSASVLNPVTPLNQTGTPGSKFTLVANVSDGCGQPVSATGLTWEILQGSASGAILSGQQTASDTSGNVSAQLTLGQLAGVVQVRVSGAGLTNTVFNITNQVVLSGISLVSGSGQSITVGQTFPLPVVVLVHDAQNHPVQGALVTFSATGGSVSPGSATTDAQGHAQTSVTAGSTAGNIVVTATASSFSVTATLLSHAVGPTLTAASFTNAASGAAGLTPCGFVTVTGTGVAPGVQGVVAADSFFGAYPHSLAGLSITVNNFPAPIQAVANDQFGQRANFQAPCEITGDTATVVVTVNGATSTITGVKLFSAQPGIFTYTGSNNKVYGGVIREADGTYVTAANPARQGEKLYVVVTGLGQTTPTLVTNSVGTGTQNVSLPTLVFLGDRAIPGLSARYLFGWVGAYLVEFQLPKDAPTGPDQQLLVVETSVDGNDFLGVSNTVLLPAVSAP
jgi:uncharacterized protein (TIGR03437 family)